MFKKNLSVMWAFTEAGIMLHNTENNSFIELNFVEEKIWRFIDGTFQPKEIALLISKENLISDVGELSNVVDRTIEKLKVEGFILQAYADIKREPTQI